MAIVPYETYQEALFNWLSFWKGSGQSPSLHKFLGGNTKTIRWANTNNYDVEVPAEAVHRVNLLASANYKTTIKLWLIRNTSSGSDLD